MNDNKNIKSENTADTKQSEQYTEPDYDLLHTDEIIQVVNSLSDSKETDKPKEIETEKKSEESENQNAQYQTPIQQYPPQYRQNSYQQYPPQYQQNPYQQYPPQYQQNQPYFSQRLYCQRCGQNHMTIQTSTKKEISPLSVILIIILVPLSLYLFIFSFILGIFLLIVSLILAATGYNKVTVTYAVCQDCGYRQKVF